MTEPCHHCGGRGWNWEADGENVERVGCYCKDAEDKAPKMTEPNPAR